MLIGSSKFAFAAFSFFISFSVSFMAFRACLRCYQWNCDWCLFRYGDLSMHWHQPHRGRKRQRLDWQLIKINFIAKFIVSLSIFYWTISPLCNLSHSFQLASTWFGHFMLSSCCVKTFLALWCCHKSRRFPPLFVAFSLQRRDACHEFVFHYFPSTLPNMPSLLMRWEFCKHTIALIFH